MPRIRRHKSSTFLISLAVVAGLTGLFVGFDAVMGDFFQRLQAAVTHYTGWFMIFAVNAALFAMAYLAFSRFRHLRLGGPDCEPEFSYPAWIGMLFAAGMGIGLLFYSVAEPLEHFRTFLDTSTGDQAAAARRAMNFTFLHWGLHPWAVYGVLALALAWFHFNKSEPLSFAAPLTAILAPRRAGVVGAGLNVLAILGTVFGVSTSLGLGAAQAGSGLSILFGWESGLGLQLVLITVVCLAASASVISGVNSGVKLISSANLIAAAGLMVFVLFAGETVFALKALGQHIGFYLNNLIETSTWRETYTGKTWQARWTLFYWSWWISWSPFVGLFIARISKGRTIGEFVGGVLLVPTLFNFVWLTVFGSNALHALLFGNGAPLLRAGPSESLFTLLKMLPFDEVTVGLATVIVLLFFVTSADSGALVTSTLANGGAEPPALERGFWTLVVLAVTATLLIAGGLEALQTATIVSGLPFAGVMLLVIWALVRSLSLSVPKIEPEPERDVPEQLPQDAPAEAETEDAVKAAPAANPEADPEAARRSDDG
ncbi:BCCT family transporter [Marinicauda salina]|nr:BCCT family transporter [Marinicauda salina]